MFICVITICFVCLEDFLKGGCIWQAYLAVLFHDLAARVASDPDFEDGSRFPSSALVFQQHPDAPTQADHD